MILSAALASGLWGIENKVEPEPVVTGNAYDRKYPARLALPRTLWESAQRLKGTKMARDWFSDAFIEHFAATREWEERGYRYSYDMLGEGARTSADAHEHFLAYRGAIDAIGRRAGAATPVAAPGVSVKLSALHPRLELAQIERVRA